MNRSKFVWGLLIGMIIGVGATLLSQQLRVSSSPSHAPAVVPRRYVISPPSQPLPSGWRQHEFNGRAYYFVPLGVASP